MALTNSDLEKIGKVVDSRVVAALEQVVFPELMKIEKKMATKEDLAKVEENLGKRIDKVAEVITVTRTNHERRIRKLEVEVGVEPGARLVV